MVKNKKSNSFYAELKSFLDDLSFVKMENIIVAVGKTLPYLFEVSPRVLGKNYKDVNLIRDYSLLKRFGYIRNVKGTKRVPVAVGNLGLHVAHTCNMRCNYCFAGDGSYGSKIKMMSPETARKAVAFFFNNNSFKKAEIIFVGGEPLLNLPAIKAALEETRNFSGYDITFKIITNGTLLNKKIVQFLKKNKIGVSISYDGQEHDRNRCFKDGKGTSETVLNNIHLLKRSGVNIQSIRACIAKNSSYSFTDVIINLMGLPIHPRKIRVTHEYKFPPRLLRKDLYIQKLRFLDQIEEWVNEGKKLRDIPLNGEEELLDVFVQARKRPLQFCGFNLDRFLVAPNGDIYFCDNTINRKGFALGNIENGIQENRLAEFMENYVATTPDECKDCYLQSLCSHHCFHIRSRRKILSKRCDFERKSFKKLLKIFLELKAEDIASIYYFHKPESKDKFKKVLSSGYKVRTMLREITTALKPINILPQYQDV